MKKKRVRWLWGQCCKAADALQHAAAPERQQPLLRPCHHNQQMQNRDQFHLFPPLTILQKIYKQNKTQGEKKKKKAEIEAKIMKVPLVQYFPPSVLLSGENSTRSEDHLLQKTRALTVYTNTMGDFSFFPQSGAYTGHPRSHLSLPWRAQKGPKGCR